MELPRIVRQAGDVAEVPVSARARGALIVTVALWAAAFPAIRVGVAGLGAAGLSLARLLVAAAALAAAAPFVGIRRPHRRDLPLIGVCGLTGMAAYQLLLNEGELTVPAGTASLLIATVPLYSAVIAMLVLGEPSSARRWLGIGLGLAGSALVALGGSGGFRLDRAALLVLAAAVAQAIYHTAQKPLLRRYTSFEVTAYAMWTGTALSLPLTPALLGSLPTAPRPALIAVLLLGLGPSALGFFTWAYAVSRVGVTDATTSLYLVPPVAVGVAFVWLHELPRPGELVGGLVAVAGVVIASATLAGRRTPTRAVRQPVQRSVPR
jgi:drug/metabolite transporter (DMT)-like permease